MRNDRLGETLRLLTARGFSSVGNHAGSRSFEGALPCKKGSVRVRLVITDWDFLSYPAIVLLDNPGFLPPLMPHVSVSRELCYFAPGSVVLDRYDPATAIAQCLEQATAILDRIASDPNYRLQDIQDEFLAHWEFGQTLWPWPVFIGSITPNSVSAHYSLLEVEGKRRAIIASDPAEVVEFSKALGSQSAVRTNCKCWLFKTSTRPAVPETMPKTTKELFTWLQQWDRAIYGGIQRVLEREKAYLEYSFVTFAIDTPIGWLGFGFDLDQLTRLGSKLNPKLYKQHLHGKGGNRLILRLSITDISPGYVHSRNLSFPDLSNKHIILVGCGAIGSFLAQSLVRLGAGLSRGSLTLIDPDTLQPENLGRHLLGYPSLFKYKADALKDHLLREFPLAKIESVPKSATEHSRLFTSDLLINATGEEAVSELLNGLRIEHHSKNPLLHVWIKGNGECVQSLWTDRSGAGCFHCLKTTDEQHYRSERFPVLNHPPIRSAVGCQAFTPYAVSSPMQAAALAVDNIIDWLKGDPSPRFRTRSIENADVRRIKNQDISRLKECSACARQ